MCPNNTGRHKRKFSITKGAHTKLGGYKKSKGSKILSIKKKSQCNDAQNQKKKKPNIGGAPWTILQINSKVQKFKKKRKKKKKEKRV